MPPPRPSASSVANGVASSSSFPAAFLWGAATASYQVEGLNRGSDWWAWEAQPGRIVAGDRSERCADWWSGRAEDDLRYAASAGHNAHRMSLEWSRIEPTPGRYDDHALARYRSLLRHAKRCGLAVSLTLNHFTLPQWAAARGGWRWDGLVSRFGAFARRCAESLSDDVATWATLNEPTVLAQGAYLGRRWPPGTGRHSAFRAAMANMLRAHVAGYESVKRVMPEAPVGLVLAMPVYEARRPERREDRVVARLHDWIFNGSVLEALRTGMLWPPLSVIPEKISSLPGSFDWLGLNYYGRYRVRFAPLRPGSAWGRHLQSDSIRTPTSDWGEAHPGGLRAQLHRLSRLGVPLYVTENGVFEDRPGRQAAYLREHVAAVDQSVAEGVDVRGYFWWTLVDNFEWAEGWGPRFGLLHLDRATQVRTPRDVASVYSEIIAQHRGLEVRPP